jgi:nascent polypeptide-associated complex subunit alpha
MIPGMNPKMMKQAMKKMGMKQEEIPATEVIIKTEDSELVVTNPQVSKINVMGQETFQISGDVHEREKITEVEITEEDVKAVVAQAQVSEEKAKQALEASKGDLAEAIMNLQE